MSFNYSSLQFVGDNLHQGDVQLYKVDPKSVDFSKLKKVKKAFAAASEKSGHAHALCGDYEQYALPYDAGYVFVVGTDGATLNHTGLHNLTVEYWDTNVVMPIADHNSCRIEPGVYIEGIQLKKKHFSSVWENVKD
jgi:hypothetical protein